MDNHQTELATRLKKEELITMASTKDFLDVFKKGNFVAHKLVMNCSKFVKDVNDFMGFE